MFTTRPDTLFGATYMVLAPEHPLVDAADHRGLARGHRRALDRWRRRRPPRRSPRTASRRRRKTDLDRQETKEKTGVFTGAYAMNPVNGERIPIFIADYVLMGYGTGAIMAVPGQDKRDFEFAEAFGLPIIRTVQPPDGFDGKAYTGDGPAIKLRSFLDGWTSPRPRRRSSTG